MSKRKAKTDPETAAAGDQSAARMTTAEKLELKNLLLLVQSAREKQKSNSKKRLTKPEIAAVVELERRQARGIDMPYMRAMPKKDFLALFGGSSKVYLDWQRRHGFPWGGGASVDAVEILIWLRAQFAGERQGKVGRDFEDVKREREELKLGRDKGELIHIKDVEAFFDAAAGEIHGLIEMVADVDPGLAELMTDRLARLEQKLLDPSSDAARAPQS